MYAPTDGSEAAVKDDFYAQLQHQLEEVPQANMLLLMGDFNAKLGCQAEQWGGAIGKLGLPAPITDNGRRLLTLCMGHSLAVADTMFQHKPVHLQTWYNPNTADRTQHQIDHTITRRRDIKSVLDTRVYRGADVDSDHRLMVSKLRFRFRKPIKHTQPKRFHPGPLLSEEGRATFQQSMQHPLSSHAHIPINDVEHRWQSLCSALTTAGNSLLQQPR